MNLIGKSTRASRFVLHPARGSDQASFSCVDQPSDLSPRSGRTITFRFIRRLRFLGQRTGHAGTACPITTETVSEEDVGLPDTDRDQAVRSDSVCTKANLIYSHIKLTKHVDQYGRYHECIDRHSLGSAEICLLNSCLFFPPPIQDRSFAVTSSRKTSITRLMGRVLGNLHGVV